MSEVEIVPLQAVHDQPLPKENNRSKVAMVVDQDTLNIIIYALQNVTLNIPPLQLIKDLKQLRKEAFQ